MSRSTIASDRIVESVRATFVCGFASVGIVALAGCGDSASLRPIIAETATAAEIVEMVNRNANAVRGLQANEVAFTLRAGSRPGERLATAAFTNLALRGRLALEQPRRFRMTAGVGFTQEADIGSNEDEFWFYLRQASDPAFGRDPQPILYHCSYEAYARGSASLPIEPEWIIESLGLTPLDPNQPHVVRPSDARSIELVTPRRLPDGRAASLVTVVERRRGWVTGIQLESGGRRIASATLSDHFVADTLGVVVPRTIALDWPEAAVQLTIRLDDPIINPTFTARETAALWTMPYDQLVGQGVARDVNLADLITPLPRRSAPPARLLPPAEGVNERRGSDRLGSSPTSSLRR